MPCCVRGLQPPPLTDKKWIAESFPQTTERMTHRGLTERQPSGCTGDALFLHQNHEDTKKV